MRRACDGDSHPDAIQTVKLAAKVLKNGPQTDQDKPYARNQL